MTRNTERQSTSSKDDRVPTVSASLDDGSMVELVFDANAHSTRFVVSQGRSWKFQETVDHADKTLVPYSPSNNLLRHGVILFPSGPADYDSDAVLASELETYIRRYVDISPQFTRIAAHYVLLSWVYDHFNELPYLRVRGDYGTGKTRFLLVVGSVMYKPIFASGASTVSPIFHMLDQFRGTLILDEADFRFSDETAEMVKILNNGNARGFPVLRTMVNDKREFNPRAFHVFGPKLIGTRGYYNDQALESRFISEEMNPRAVRKDIPINLPDEQKHEALVLRNKLLLYRMRNYGRAFSAELDEGARLEGRIQQMVLPLLAVATDDRVRQELANYARNRSRDLKDERGMTVEAQLLEVIAKLQAADSGSRLTLKAITSAFAARFGREYEERITNRWIGSILRKQLLLKPRKSHGVYILPTEELLKLGSLCERYGIGEQLSPQTETCNGVRLTTLEEITDEDDQGAASIEYPEIRC